MKKNPNAFDKLIELDSFLHPENRMKVFDEEMLTRIKNYALVQMTMEQIAEGLGLTNTEFKVLRANHPEIDVTISAAKLDVVAQVASALIKAAKYGNVNAQKFFLERKGGWIERKHVEIPGLTGAIAETIDDALNKKLTPEEAQNKYAELIKRGKECQE